MTTKREFDFILRNGRVYDGAGNPWRNADVGLKGKRISRIGPLSASSANRVIDCTGLVVCPGFIDMHSHSDLMIFSEPEASAKVMQGVTTEVLGQDGQSVAPIKDKDKSNWRRHLSGLLGDPEVEWTWNAFDEYLSALEKARPTTNLVSLVPHGSLRLWVMGMENRKPTDGEMKKMARLLRESLEAGAAGMSTGLIYPPCPYADVNELAEFCKVLRKHGKFFVVHIRSEDAELMESLDEMVEVARLSGAPVHISHLKVAGKPQYGRAGELLERIDAARAEGLEITFDQHPYTAGSTMLFALLPQWLQEGGSDKMLERLTSAEIRQQIMEEMASRTSTSGIGLTDIIVSSVKSEKNKYLEGKNLFEVAEAMDRPFVDAVCDLLVEEDLNVSMIIFLSDEADVKTILKHPAGTICTDGLLGGKPHPRAYGTFPRVLGRYCRDENVLDLAEAIRKITSAGAQRLGLADRGLLKEGFCADVVAFNPKTIIDTSTYENPRLFPTGIEHVFINGKHVASSGKQIGAKTGKILRIP
ncbi:MAG: D-aminoacylase [Candidatus Abyssobacteria bacterium SURF_17]|uniref:D-aminoacylase n=1 Tax=Candidatus Abyssobacteria bacterium SURF_17 TaxID=2093361 RepID=A0A419EPC7_9BACT|nr:MAG: D-aminoacylase [Candidatus Abyssubacteria bacterium SURF_17]